jgi:glycosyltransferase involved in cell wall biosynthesis
MADQSADGLTFVLPVFDQEKTLAKVVSSWQSALDSLQRPYEVLIVDDGSRDGTRAQADLLATRITRLKVLAHPERMGFGAAIKTALEAASHPLFFYTSADHGWSPNDLTRMLRALAVRDEFTGKQVEIVNGHRRGTALPAGRRRLGSIYRALVRICFGHHPEPAKGWLGSAENRYWWKCRLLFGLRVGDINSKFKLFRRTVFDKMVLQSDGEFIHAEILAKGNFLGCLMDEIVLGDWPDPPVVPDVGAEMWRVFRDPQFRSPVPTRGLAPTPNAHVQQSAEIAGSEDRATA